MLIQLISSSTYRLQLVLDILRQVDARLGCRIRQGAILLPFGPRQPVEQAGHPTAEKLGYGDPASDHDHDHALACTVDSNVISFSYPDAVGAATNALCGGTCTRTSCPGSASTELAAACCPCPATALSVSQLYCRYDSIDLLSTDR